MRPFEAVFEQGRLKPLQRLPLSEHQHVWVTILSDDLLATHLTRLAAESPSLKFLADPAEDLYSPDDGEPV
jgi:predicted DNA-binding antitoxin AbrB/MazE fold protein